MPEWEFNGFPTKEAWEADDYNEDYDKSPDPAQIKAAFTIAVHANGVDALKSLGKLIGPDLIRAYVAGLMKDSLEQRRLTSGSATSSATSGPDTPSTTSGTTDPTTSESLV